MHLAVSDVSISLVLFTRKSNGLLTSLSSDTCTLKHWQPLWPWSYWTESFPKKDWLTHMMYHWHKMKPVLSIITGSMSDTLLAAFYKLILYIFIYQDTIDPFYKGTNISCNCEFIKSECIGLRIIFNNKYQAQIYDKHAMIHRNYMWNGNVYITIHYCSFGRQTSL